MSRSPVTARDLRPTRWRRSRPGGVSQPEASTEVSEGGVTLRRDWRRSQRAGRDTYAASGSQDMGEYRMARLNQDIRVRYVSTSHTGIPLSVHAESYGFTLGREGPDLRQITSHQSAEESAQVGRQLCLNLLGDAIEQG